MNTIHKNHNPLITVLLADDHNIVRAGFRHLLDQTPDIHVVAEVSNGKEACEMLEKLNPDVAVLDIQMPIMSGIEVTRWVRANQFSIGVMILTAYDDEPYIRAVIQAGANGFVLKSADPEEMISGIRDVYHGKLILDMNNYKKIPIKLAEEEKPSVLGSLTELEFQILSLISKGFTNESICIQQCISEETLQNSISSILKKMNVKSCTEAIIYAKSLGFIS